MQARYQAARAAGLALLLAVGTAAQGGQNQQPNRDRDTALDPPPRPVTLLLTDRPLVSVQFRGDHGPVTVMGTLEEAPRTALRLTDQSGRTRDTSWSDLRELRTVRSAVEGLAEGSFSVRLASDPADGPNYGSGTSGIGSLGNRLGGWRVLRLPEGSLSLRGNPYGALTVPLARVTDFSVLPITGTIATMPAGQIRLEILEGKTVEVPLAQLQALSRDIPRGTAVAALADGQSFTGKLLELPRVSLVIEPTGTSIQTEPQTIPLERISQLQITVIPGSRPAGTPGTVGM